MGIDQDKVSATTKLRRQVEDYIRDRTEVEFSHGICPECVKMLYPGYED